MSAIFDQANNLEKALRESPEFQQLKGAYEAVMSDPTAKSTFEDFRNTQFTLQEKQMQGQEITQEEVQNAQEVVSRAENNEVITELMKAEQGLNTIIEEISAIITKPLEEVYGLNQED